MKIKEVPMKSKIALLSLGLGLASGTITAVWATGPNTLGFVGTLTDSVTGSGFDGAVDIRVKLFATPTAGAPLSVDLMSNSQECFMNTPVSAGRFGLQLGSIHPFAPSLGDFVRSNPNLYVEIQVCDAGTSCGTCDDPMSPRVSVNSTPMAATLDGKSQQDFVQVSGNSTPYTVTKAALDTLTGGLGVQDASTLHHHDSLYARLSGSSSISINAGSYLGLGSRASDPAGLVTGDAGKTWFDSTTHQVKYWDGTAVQALGTAGGGVTSVTSAGAPITIGGTASVPTVGISQASSVSNGFLSSADWLTFNNKTSSQWTTNGSSIYYNTGGVGIGTSTPVTSLDVMGSIKAGNKVGIGVNPDTWDVDALQVSGGNSAPMASIEIRNATTAKMYRLLNSASSQLQFQDVNSGMVRMTIDSTGNVGIGTTAPTASLDVQGPSGLSVGSAISGAPIMNMKICSAAAIGGGTVTTTTPVTFTITCGGAAVGSVVSCSPDINPGATISWSAGVFAVNQITVKLANTGTGSATAANWKCMVAN